MATLQPKDNTLSSADDRSRPIDKKPSLSSCQTDADLPPAFLYAKQLSTANLGQKSSGDSFRQPLPGLGLQTRSLRHCHLSKSTNFFPYHLADANPFLALPKQPEPFFLKPSGKPPGKPVDKQVCKKVLPKNYVQPRQSLLQGQRDKKLTTSAPEFERPAAKAAIAPPVIHSDPLEPYYQSIFNHMCQNRLLNKCKQNPFHRQSEISKQMRFLVFDWLLGSLHAYKQKLRTIFLAGSMLDRYLEKKEVQRSKFQLVGVSCLFMAGKFEDIRPPSLRQMTALLDDNHEKADILKTESDILLALNFDFHAHLAVDFAEIVVRLAGLRDSPVILELAYEVLVVFACHHHIDKFDPVKLAYFAVAFALKNRAEARKNCSVVGLLPNCEYLLFERKMKKIIAQLRVLGLKSLDKVNSVLNTASLSKE